MSDRLPPPLFSTRAVTYLRSAVAHYGSVAEASRQLNIPQSTLNGLVSGRTRRPSTLTVQRAFESVTSVPKRDQWRIAGGVDALAKYSGQRQLDRFLSALDNRSGWVKAVNIATDQWHREQERREDMGEPALDSGLSG